MSNDNCFGFPVSEEEYEELQRIGSTTLKNTKFYAPSINMQVPIGWRVKITSISSRQHANVRIIKISKPVKNRQGLICREVVVERVICSDSSCINLGKDYSDGAWKRLYYRDPD
jgi:hypothetical protein